LVVPSLVALAFIHTYAVNTIILDRFAFVPFVLDYSDGRIDCVQLLTMQFNQHRTGVTGLLMLAIGLATGLSSLSLIYTTWLFVFLSELVLLHLFIRIFGRNLRSLLLFVPVAFLLFSLNPYEVFLYDTIVMSTSSMFYFLLTVDVIFDIATSKWIWAQFTGGVAAALVASFSGSAGGLCVWPVGLALLNESFNRTQSNRAKTFRLMSSIWSFMGLFVAIIYFSGLEMHHVMVPPLPMQDTIKLFISYTFTLFGSFLSKQPSIALFAGPFIILLYLLSILFLLATLFTGGNRRGLVVGLSLAFFGVATSAMVVIGRAGLGDVVQATSPRYVQFANIGLIGLYLALLVTNVKQRSNIKNCLLFLVVALCTGEIISGYASARQIGTILKDRHNIVAYYLRTYRIQPNEVLRSMYTDPAFARQIAQQMDERKLSVFSAAGAHAPHDQPPSLSALPCKTAQYAIDTINNDPVKDDFSNIILPRLPETPYVVSGWSVNRISLKPWREVRLLVDRDREIPVCYGLNRPDVAALFADAQASNCGFLASFSSAVLPVGRHTLSLRFISDEGPSVIDCSPFAQVDVQ
jgi:hypothetical protein